MFLYSDSGFSGAGAAIVGACGRIQSRKQENVRRGLRKEGKDMGWIQRPVVVTFGAVVLAACAVACSSSGTDDEAARWAREVQVLSPEHLQAMNRDYDVVGNLEERVTLGPTGDREAALREAERRLRFRAAKLDADAVVVYDCRRAADFEARTSPAYVCQGAAVRWKFPTP